MRRWRLALALAMVILFGVSWYAWKRREQKRYAQEKREATYQAALSSYAKDVKPGMTRKEVEDYLHGKKVALRQMCCIGKPQDVWADLVRIGQEPVPWVCSENNVYIAFDFAAVEHHDLWQSHDSDQLRQVTIFHWLEGCM